MDMPKPGAEHRELERLAGSWKGEEIMQRMDGAILFKGHGVWHVDPATPDEGDLQRTYSGHTGT
jgi:hypothetical protein